ncbi:hypothetical protein SDC9_85482 [bioreactor metagenome]|uniref:Uncharacterized protein n=1 Tax=bioreactor metagenome TaxID=1076179 RepID=A0A644ZDB6_9ZZZZ
MLHGADEQSAHALQGVDVLHDDRSAQHGDDTDGEQCRGGDHRVSQNVHAAHPESAETLAPGKVHIVLRAYVHNVVARVADNDRGGEKRLGERRQEQPLNVICNGYAPTRNGKPPQMNAKDQHEHQPHPEGGQG